MGSDQSQRDAALDQVLERGNASLRRSADQLRAIEELLETQRHTLTAADETLDRARQLLGGVDIDLRAVEANSPTRVLVVDDNPSIRELVRLMLTLEFGEQIEVRLADGGVAAVALARWQPHMAIIDWVMPEIDGLETTRRLRPALPEARLVVYSSRLAAEVADHAVAAGADLYLEKGSDPSGLIDEVRDVIDRARGSTYRAGLRHLSSK